MPVVVGRAEEEEDESALHLSVVPSLDHILKDELETACRERFGTCSRVGKNTRGPR